MKLNRKEEKKNPLLSFPYYFDNSQTADRRTRQRPPLNNVLQVVWSAPSNYIDNNQNIHQVTGVFAP
jgi:hypothetical protein